MARGRSVEPTHLSRSISVEHDGPVRVAIVADSHSRPHPATGELLAGLEPDAILHAGDIGDLGVLERLGAIAPVLAVRGNIDVKATQVPDSMDVAIGPPSDAHVNLLLTHIAVRGPKLMPSAAKLARTHGAGLVVCGHSHVPFLGRDRGLGVFNPGSIGPRRFHLPITFGLLEVSTQRVDFRHIDCETGLPWVPPALA